MIIGIPGSGKTILSQQYAFHNATSEQPALYLSTVTEPLDKIIRYGQSLDFFDAAAISERRVIYEDLGVLLTRDGLGGAGTDSPGLVLQAIDRYLKRLKPGIVVIDSFRAFHAFAKDEHDFRLFLNGLIRRLTAASTTSIWNAPYTQDQAQQAAEFAAADGAISLDIKRQAGREMRVLQVLKLRGSGFRSGEHAYRVSTSGIDVFPRLADEQDRSGYELEAERVATGVPALDRMLGDGYWAGSSTLICGPSGVGKTLMGLHFIFEGARTGQPGIVATFQETPNQLARIVAGYGWSIDQPGVHILSSSLVDMYIDQWVYELLDLIEKTGAKRIVIDSLVDLMVTAGDPVRFREWMYSLVHRCARQGISLMMIVEVPDLFQLRRISEQGISHLSDNVVLLQYVQDGSRLARAITVLKTRASRHEPVAHRYEISSDGLVLGDEITLER
jgi:circadian clock protein KaiC